MSKTVKNISEKNKKSEILEEYNRLLNKLKEKNKNAQDIKVIKEEKEIVEETKKLSSDKIVMNLAEVKLQITKAFELLERKMSEQYKKFTDLQNAIEIEKRNIQEVHEIKVSADSLAALIQAKKEYEEDFKYQKEQEEYELQEEVKEKRGEWEKEKNKYESEIKERQILEEKKRKREEEEYKYNLAKQRREDKDQYERKKAALEMELKEKKRNVEMDLKKREEEIILKEQEYISLKDQVEKFPKELEISVENSEKEVKEKIVKDFEYKHVLLKKEMESDKKLYEQKISYLENKITEMQKHIEQLTKKTSEASEQVQNIAIKAVEGALPRVSDVTEFQTEKK